MIFFCPKCKKKFYRSVATVQARINFRNGKYKSYCDETDKMVWASMTEKDYKKTNRDHYPAHR